ncbi:MAG: AAA family ATPase [Clostridia bacterium]|nr:AAA family ATPase [Clostridia bacterium]
MIFLSTFRFPSTQEDEGYFFNRENSKNMRNIYTTKYPFMMFRSRGLPDEFIFSDITVFCGNNGSGKSTILNVIAEKLGLKRSSPFNRSDFFDDYVGLCDYTLEKSLSRSSGVITSDDVFDRVLDIRRVNNGIDRKREDLLQEWLDSNSDLADTALHGLDDYERWKRVSAARNKNITQSQFIRSRLVRNIQERSNGESSLSLFVDSIADDALYILDEPENSLSPENQLELKYFIEDCVRNHGCQFIISTHSPFLLSLKGARIYDIDSNPVETKKWTELSCVNIYRDFFTENEFRFSD